MECIICKKEFKPVNNIQRVCFSDECRKEYEKLYNEEYYKLNVKDNRKKLTERQIEANRKRNREKYQKMTTKEREAYKKYNRDKYRNMSPEDKRAYLDQLREKRKNKKK